MEGQKADIRNKVLPGRVGELDEVTGGKVEIVVLWDSFKEAKAVEYVDTLCFHKLAMAYRTVGFDDVGKECLRKINVIEVTHTNAPKVELVKDKLVVQGDYTKHDNTPNDRDISKYLDEHLCINAQRVRNRVCNEQLPAFRKDALEVLGGGAFDWEIDVPSFTTTGCYEFVGDVCCHRTLMAFRSIRDGYGQEGQTTLRNKVLKARFRHITKENERKVTLEGGVLHIHELIDRTSPLSGQINLISHNEIETAIVDALKMKMALNLSNARDKQLPERIKEVQEIWGSADLTYEVDWDSFTNDTELNYVDNVSCHRVSMALRCLSYNKNSWGSLKAKGLRKIRLQNTTNPSATAISVKDGVLSMTCHYASGISGAFSDSTISHALQEYAP